MKSFLKIAALVAAMHSIGGAHAAIGYCNNYLVAPNTFVQETDAIQVSDVTYNSANSDNCFGVADGNTPNNINNLQNVFGSDTGAAGAEDIINIWGGGWSLLDKSDSPSEGPLGGFTFTVSEQNTGVYQVSVTGMATLPAFFDFVAGLKQGNDYALFLFDDVAITGSNDGGTYFVSWVINGPNVGTVDLSHFALYGRDGEDPPDECTPPDDCDPPNEVPEPGTLALVGLALLGLGRRAMHR